MTIKEKTAKEFLIDREGLRKIGEYYHFLVDVVDGKELWEEFHLCNYCFVPVKNLNDKYYIAHNPLLGIDMTACENCLERMKKSIEEDVKILERIEKKGEEL